MKFLVPVAMLLACAFSSDAQIGVTLNEAAADGSTEIKVRNNSAGSLVALAIRLNRVGRGTETKFAPFVTYYDPTIDAPMKPLAPNEERTFGQTMLFCGPERGRVDLGNAPGKKGHVQDRKEFLCVFEQPIVAGILADGSTIGDAGLLGRMLLRRSNMLLAVETAREMLSEAGRYNVPRDQLIKQFKKMVDSLNHWYLPREQQIGRGVYQSIIGKLMNLPQGELGAPFPPSSFVEQETAILNEQRIRLSESQPSLLDGTESFRDRLPTPK